MLEVTIANIIGVLLALLGRLTKREKDFLFLATIFLIVFYGVRTDYGNDLPAYMEEFDMIANCPWADLFSYMERLEPGWIILNKLFSPLGWQSFIFFLTIILIYTPYWLITKFCKREYYWILFALFVFNADMLITCTSMIRQSLAMSICCFVLPDIMDKKYIKSVLVILLATTMHTSAWMVLILLVLPFLENVNRKFIVIGVILLMVLLFVVGNVMEGLLTFITSTEDFERYDYYLEDAGSGGNGLGLVLNIIIWVWMLKQCKSRTMMFFCLCIGLTILTSPLGYLIASAGRVQMYFYLFGLPAWQLMLENKNDNIGKILFGVYFVIRISGYFGFFESPIYHDDFAVYHTIFD